MTKDQLEEKLEKMSLPILELSGHRQKLRWFLLQEYAKLGERPEFLAWFWKGATVLSCSLAALLFLFYSSSVFLPRDASLAREIAVQDARVKALIEEGAIINTVEVSGDQAFVSLKSPLLRKGDSLKVALPAASGSSAENLFQASTPPPSQTVFLIDIDLKKRAVTNVQEVEWRK